MTVHKDADYVSPMFRSAKMRIGCALTVLVFDKDRTYHDAWNKEYRPKNPPQKDTIHDSHIHANSDQNNNKMERFNDELRTRIKTMRGREGDTCMALLRVCHNYVRPHMGLGGNMTPSEAAGISIPDRNKWAVLIQNARPSAIRADRNSRHRRTDRIPTGVPYRQMPPQRTGKHATLFRTGCVGSGREKPANRIPAADTITRGRYAAWIENTRIQERTPRMDIVIL